MNSTVEQFLSNSYDRIERVCDRFVQRRYWRIELSLICLGVVFFVSTPYLYYLDENVCGTWNIVLSQIDDPTKQYGLAAVNAHDAKRSFRLTVPMICKLLGVKHISLIYLLQLVVTLLFFRLIIRFSEKLSNHSLIKVIIPIASCFTAFGQVGVFDVMAKFDVFALFFILSAIVFERTWVISLGVLLACFTDERAFVASGMIILWWQLAASDRLTFSIRRMFLLNQRSVSVVLGMLTYILLRWYITVRYDFVTPIGDMGMPVLLRQSNMYLFGVWSGFEGFWIVVLLAMFLLWYQKCYRLLLLIMLSALPSLIVANGVMDLTRSMIYLLPLLLIAFKILHARSSERTFGRLVLIVFFINVLVPTYWAIGSTLIYGNNPFFIRIFGIFN